MENEDENSQGKGKEELNIHGRAAYSSTYLPRRGITASNKIRIWIYSSGGRTSMLGLILEWLCLDGVNLNSDSYDHRSFRFPMIFRAHKTGRRPSRFSSFTNILFFTKGFFGFYICMICLFYETPKKNREKKKKSLGSSLLHYLHAKGSFGRKMLHRTLSYATLLWIWTFSRFLIQSLENSGEGGRGVKGGMKFPDRIERGEKKKKKGLVRKEHRID